MLEDNLREEVWRDLLWYPLYIKPKEEPVVKQIPLLVLTV